MNLPVQAVLEMTIFVLVGASVGSFLNVCIDRLPAGESLLRLPSLCPACRRRPGIAELVPVFGYLWLRGRCRHCGSPIPARLPLVELTEGLVFALVWHLYGLTPLLAIALFYACLFTVIFVIDLERRLILNKVVLPAMMAAFLLSPLVPGVGFVNSLLGGLAGFGILAVPSFLYRGGIGAGDVKLAALLGLMAGFPNVLVALSLAVVSGGIVGGIVLIAGLKGRKDAIPFGPYLAAAGMITLLWGKDILRWYWRG